MAFSAGEVEAIFKMRDQLTKQVKQVKGSLRDAGRAAQDAGRAFETAGTKIQSAGSAMLPFSAALAVASGATFKLGKDFDASMTRIVTLVGIGEKTVDGFRRQVLDLAGETARAPQELADALFVVTSAGARGADAMDILTVAAKASAVGLGDTGEIARTITASIQAYGKENLTASQAANVLFKTVREGNLNAEDLSGSLGRVIGVAAAMGVEFSSVGATIATYTRLGVSAEEATTGLRSVLTGLIKPTTDAKKALAEVGLSAEGLRQQIKDKGLASVLVDLANQFRGNDEALARVIPNVRALSTILGVAGTQSEAFLAIEKSIATQTDALGAGFERTAKTIDFKFNQALSDMQQIAVSAFEAFKGQFASLLSGLASVTGSITEMVNRLGEVSGVTKTVLAALVGLGVLAAPGLIALGSAVRLVGFAMQGLGLMVVRTQAIMIAFGNLTPVLTLRLAFMAGGVKALAVSFAGLIASMGPFAIAVGVAVAAFALFKFLEKIGAIDKLSEAIDRLILKLKGLSDAEIDVVQATRGLVDPLSDTAKFAADLGEELNESVGLAGNMKELETAFNDFNQTGRTTVEAMRMIADRALELQANGEKLSPTMQKLVDQLGTMDEAARRAADGLKANTNAAADAADAARALEKAEKELAQAFSQLGFTTVPEVIAALTTLAQVEQRAMDQGASARTVALQLVDAYADLKQAAAESGIEVEGLTAAVEANALAMNFGVPAIKRLSFEEGVLALGALKSAAELEGVTQAMMDNWKAAGELAGAYDTLGIRTQASMTTTREEAQRAFDLISTSAEATKQDVARATKALADAVKAETGRAGVEGSRAFALMGKSIEGTYAQMLSGTKSFADGFSDIWNSIKAGFLGGLTEMLGGFLGRFIPGMSQGFGSLSGTAQTSGGGILSAFKGLFGGGGGSGGALGETMTAGMTAMSGIMTAGFGLLLPIAVKFLGPLAAKIGGLFKKIFGGPSEEELAGRGVSDEFKAWAREAKTAADTIEIARLVSQGWARDLATQVVVVTAKYAEVGLSAQEAQRDVKATWAAIKKGPAEVAAAVELIQAKLESVGTSAMEATDVTKEAFGSLFAATVEGGTGVSAMLVDVAAEVIGLMNAASEAGVAMPASFRPIVQRLEEMGLLVDETGQKIHGMSSVNFADPMVEKFVQVSGKLKELIDRLVGPSGAVESVKDLARSVNNIPNRTIKIGFNVADFRLPDFGGEGSQIPDFAHGGIVPGPRGRPVLAQLHGGETVVPGDARSGGGQATMERRMASIEELLRIQRRTTRALPGMLARATRDAVADARGGR